MIPVAWFFIVLSWCALVGASAAGVTIALVARARDRPGHRRVGVLDDPRSARRLLVGGVIAVGVVMALVTVVGAVAFSIWIVLTFVEA